MATNIRFQGLVKTTAEIESDKFSGRIGFNSTLARFVAYYNSTDYATMARRDVLETFALGIQDSTLTSGKIVVAGASGRLQDGPLLTDLVVKNPTAGQVITGQSLTIDLSDGGFTAFGTRVNGASPANFAQMANGRHAWGPGGSARNVFLDYDTTGMLLTGTWKVSDLAGTGTRPLVADANGKLAAQDAATFRGTIGAVGNDDFARTVTPVQDCLDTPPVSPVTTLPYLVGPAATGAWSGQDGKLAYWSGTAWSFKTRSTLDLCTISEFGGRPGLVNFATGTDGTSFGVLASGNTRSEHALFGGVLFHTAVGFSSGPVTRTENRSYYINTEATASVFYLNGGGSQLVYVVNKGASTLTVINASPTISLVLNPGENALFLGASIISVYRARSFATIYASSAAAAQSIPTGTTWTKLTPFNANDTDYTDSTPDQANDRIVIGRAGRYEVVFSRSFSSGSTGFIGYTAILVNGSPQTNKSIRRKAITAANTQVDAELSVQLTCAAGDVITVGTYHDHVAAVNLTYDYAVLSVTAID